MHESVYDEFIEKAKARAVRRSVGDPFKKGVEQGPQVFSLSLLCFGVIGKVLVIPKLSGLFFFKRFLLL